MKPITILNTSILTNYGTYDYQPTDIKTAKELISKYGFNSAVGHQSTCDILSKLLGVTIPLNRIEFKHEMKDVCLVFKLNKRPEEGRILTEKEIEEIGYSFGILKKLGEL